MPDPSLNRRLDTHARRSGFAVGASMAVTIALLIGGFVWLFAAINPYLSDFIGADPRPTERSVAAQGAGDSPRPSVAAPTATQAPADAPTQAAAAPTEAPQPTEAADGDFQADYQVAGDAGINFRDDPGTDGTQTIDVLDPGTPLQSTGERETVNGAAWLQFTDEEGRVGWIREIDVSTV